MLLYVISLLFFLNIAFLKAFMYAIKIDHADDNVLAFDQKFNSAQFNCSNGRVILQINCKQS